jgi:hypothetical protein
MLKFIFRSCAVYLPLATAFLGQALYESESPSFLLSTTLALIP